MLGRVRYDARHSLDPKRWLDLDEDTRVHQVREYHRRTKVQLPNATLHALIHVVVENQIAIGDTVPVGGILNRLLGEGLDRHDAIHAIGSVLVRHMNGILGGSFSEGSVNLQYFEELSHLSASSWRASD